MRKKRKEKFSSRFIAIFISSSLRASEREREVLFGDKNKLKTSLLNNY
jgi:hypothetical protein